MATRVKTLLRLGLQNHPPTQLPKQPKTIAQAPDTAPWGPGPLSDACLLPPRINRRHPLGPKTSLLLPFRLPITSGRKSTTSNSCHSASISSLLTLCRSLCTSEIFHLLHPFQYSPGYLFLPLMVSISDSTMAPPRPTNHQTPSSSPVSSNVLPAQQLTVRLLWRPFTVGAVTYPPTFALGTFLVPFTQIKVLSPSTKMGSLKWTFLVPHLVSIEPPRPLFLIWLWLYLFPLTIC